MLGISHKYPVPFNIYELLGEVPGRMLDIHEKNRLKYVTKEDLETLQHRSKVEVVEIVGLGGLGKTKLTKEVFNNKSSAYSRSCFLSNVKEISKTSLQGELYKDLEQIDTIDEVVDKLFKLISSRKLLIVLYDVDHADQIFYIGIFLLPIA